jgi:putative membrane protein
MMHHLIHLLVFAAIVLVTAKLIPGIRVKSYGSAVVFALVYAVLNKLLFGVFVFFTFPLVFLTLGLFLLVINAFILWLADKVVSGVEIESFGAAVLVSLVTSVLNVVVTRLI